MSPVYNTKYNYTMLYVPKAACSLIRKIYTEIHLDEFTQEQQFFLNKRGVHHLKDIHSIRDQGTEKSVNNFIVCRNPYTRCLSAFYDKFLFLKQEAIKDWHSYKTICFFELFLRTKEINVFQKANLLDNSVFSSKVEFVQFFELLDLEYVQSKEHYTFEQYLTFLLFCKSNNLHTVENCIYDVHHDTQVTQQCMDFFKPKIIKVERFDLLLPHYKKILKRDYTSKETILKTNLYTNIYINSTPDKIDVNHDTSQWNKQQILDFLYKTNKLPSIKSMLTDVTLELIHNIYDIDFKLLRYTKNQHEA